MSTSLIISIYRLQNELPLLLSAIAQQSQLPGEIIFAEDDISEETIRILEAGKRQYPQLRMKLVQHEDRGFRKAEIVNKAVTVADHEKLIFLDGDCLPHKHYVKSYADNLNISMLLNARPVYLPADLRAMFMDSSGAYCQPGLFQVFSKAFSGARYALYMPLLPLRSRNSAMRGSSWACMRSEYLAVNGFDERFCEAGYGYEDIDISHRLNRSGVLCYVPKYRVIYYHFGPAGSGDEKSEALKLSKRILENNDSGKIVSCEIGVNQWIGRVSLSWASM